MSKIPTAEEFFREKYGVADRISLSNAALLAVEFAKLHVKAALEAAVKTASMKGTCNGRTSIWEDEVAIRDIDGDFIHLRLNHDEILNAYPDERIK